MHIHVHGVMVTPCILQVQVEYSTVLSVLTPNTDKDIGALLIFHNNTQYSQAERLSFLKQNFHTAAAAFRLFLYPLCLFLLGKSLIIFSFQWFILIEISCLCVIFCDDSLAMVSELNIRQCVDKTHICSSLAAGMDQKP